MGRPCTKCKRFKEWECFHRNKLGTYGREGQCKKCRNKKQRNRRKRISKRLWTIRDGSKLKMNCIVIGKPSIEALDYMAMILAEAYLNCNGSIYEQEENEPQASKGPCLKGCI